MQNLTVWFCFCFQDAFLKMLINSVFSASHCVDFAFYTASDLSVGQLHLLSMLECHGRGKKNVETLLESQKRLNQEVVSVKIPA